MWRARAGITGGGDFAYAALSVPVVADFRCGQGPTSSVERFFWKREDIGVLGQKASSQVIGNKPTYPSNHVRRVLCSHFVEVSMVRIVPQIGLCGDLLLNELIVSIGLP